MKKVKLVVAVVVLLLLVCVITITCYVVFNRESQTQFYVGVTYCGSSVEEAKELIDKVKNYTNLFILQSGTLQHVSQMEEIGDYAIASNLKFAAYTSGYLLPLSYYSSAEGVNAAKERWGEDFIGIYYYDEPGGDMLDESFYSLGTAEYQIDGNTIPVSILKNGDRIDCWYFNNKTAYQVNNSYWPDGRIDSTFSNGPNWVYVNYYPNGTIAAHVPDYNAYVTDIYTSENITQCPVPIQPYEEILKQNPMRTYDDVAHAYTSFHKNRIESINKTLIEAPILVSTADYGLYWWDYKGGYDLVLAELA